MPPPTNTPEQRRLAKRYESCFRAYGKGLAIQAGGNVLRDGNVEVYASPTQTVFNSHLPRACPANQIRNQFETTLRLGVQQPSGLGILVGPSVQQEAWAEVLKENGLRCGYWVPFMHRDLDRPIPAAKKVEGIRIRSQRDFSIFEKHPHPYIGKASTDQRKAEIAFGEKRVKKGNAVQILAFAEDVPVGAATVFLHRGAAAIFNVGVLSEYRQRGIGGQLMLASLETARENGADCAVLSAASKAVPVYERVGFTSAGHYGSYYIGRARLEKWVQHNEDPSS